MRRPAPVQLAIIFLLMLCIAVVGARCVSLLWPGAYDISRSRSHMVDPGTIEYLKSLDEPVFVTYAVSARCEMPSQLKRVERGVVAILKSLRDAAPDKFDYIVVDPSGNKNMVGIVASKKISPFHSESILDDKKTEKVVWSSIVVSMGARRDVVLHRITEAYLPHLESLIVGHLKNMKTPIKPVIGVVTPESGFASLRAVLENSGRVENISINSESGIPADIDMLYWMDPADVRDRTIMELRRFVESGRNVVLAGSLYKISMMRGRDGGLLYNVSLEDPSINKIIKKFGLEMKKSIVLDERSETINVPGEKGGSRQVSIPFAIRTTPVTHNLKSFAGPNTGALGFYASVPINMNESRLRAFGYEAQTVVTSSENVWTVPLDEARFSEEQFAPTIMKTKQPLAVMLSKPGDPFHGKLLVLSSSSMFTDQGLAKQGFGHRAFLRLLGRTFLSAQELVKMRVERRLPDLLPDMTPAGIIYWRVFAMVFIPAFVLLVMLIRTGLPRVSFGPWLRIATEAGAVAIIALVVARLISGALGAARVDMTANRVNSMAEFTRETVGDLAVETTATLYTTRRALMPVGLKKAQEETIVLARTLCRMSGGKLKFTIVYPDDLEKLDRDILIKKGIKPTGMEVTEYDRAVTRNIWNDLVFESGGRMYRLPFIRENSASQIEFMIDTTLKAIERGKEFHVAVASDLPRLSPAEAFEDYYKKQLTAPVGSDVYSEAKDMLRANNYRVTDVNPRKPEVPPDTDVLIWLQPRRPVEKMAVELLNYLDGGGMAMIAAQHYNIQQRQYRGRGFRTVYWPQPQYIDMNDWLDLIGITIEKEVFMDEVQTQLELEMQINRLAVREYEDQAVAKPFLIRAINPNFSHESPITANLGDLLFIWGNRFTVDRQKLEAAGLRYNPLVSSSPHSWKYDWKGGFLGEDVFNKRDYLEGGQLLSLLVSGDFPHVRLYKPEPITNEDGEQVMPYAGASGAGLIQVDKRGGGSTSRGELILTGSSQMFTNAHLRQEGFDHAQFLLNSIAYLALGPGAARLQAKNLTPEGFEQPDERIMLLMRILTMGFLPFVFLIYGAARFTLERRKKNLAFRD